MSIHGFKVTATRNSGRITEEEAERIYDSLHSNFALKSIDMFMDEDENTFTFMLGVECPDWVESDKIDFVRGVASDAMEKAITDLDDRESFSRELNTTLVGAFGA